MQDYLADFWGCRLLKTGYAAMVDPQIAKVNYVFNSIGELQFVVPQRLSLVWVKFNFYAVY